CRGGVARVSTVASRPGLYTRAPAPVGSDSDTEWLAVVRAASWIRLWNRDCCRPEPRRRDPVTLVFRGVGDTRRGGQRRPTRRADQCGRPRLSLPHRVLPRGGVPACHEDDRDVVLFGSGPGDRDRGRGAHGRQGGAVSGARARRLARRPGRGRRIGGRAGGRPARGRGIPRRAVRVRETAVLMASRRDRAGGATVAPGDGWLSGAHV